MDFINKWINTFDPKINPIMLGAINPPALPNVLATPKVVPAKSGANSEMMGYSPAVVNPYIVMLAIDRTMIHVLLQPRNGIINRQTVGPDIA